MDKLQELVLVFLCEFGVAFMLHFSLVSLLCAAYAYTLAMVYM